MGLPKGEQQWAAQLWWLLISWTKLRDGVKSREQTLEVFNMPNSQTFAERDVAGGTLYMFKAPAAKRWRIRYWSRYMNPTTALAEGVLRKQQWMDQRYLKRTYSTPDDAANEVRRVLAA
jgi:hypothetical protein